MTARRIGYLIGIAVLGSSGAYLFIYLYRWEFHRALVAGILFVAAEVALLGASLIERMGRLEKRLDQAARDDGRRREPAPEVLARIKETAPAPSDPFAWLDPRDHSANVFVPVLMGAGIVASGLAWLVERIARATARPALERGLAAKLTPLTWPEGGLVAGQGEDETLRLLLGPGGR